MCSSQKVIVKAWCGFWGTETHQDFAIRLLYDLGRITYLNLSCFFGKKFYILWDSY